MKMVGQKSESQQYLLAQIRSQTFSEGIGKDNTVNQLVMASLEAKIAGNEDFLTTDYLMQMVQNDQEQKVGKPNRTVFDEEDKDTYMWHSTNEFDIVKNYDSYTYENYKYLQL